MKNGNCKGCLSDLSDCDKAEVNKNGDCPCTNCLVKVICGMLCYNTAIFLDPDTPPGAYDEV